YITELPRLLALRSSGTVTLGHVTCPRDINASMTNSTVTSKPPVTLRLVVPASQCGSLIGKGGSKIKEIREVSLGVSQHPSGTEGPSSILVGTAPGQQRTEGAEGALQPFPNQFQPLQPGKGPGSSTGAQVQVAGDMLPNSTERAVTISGTPDAIIQCVKQICVVMLEVSKCLDYHLSDGRCSNTSLIFKYVSPAHVNYSLFLPLPLICSGQHLLSTVINGDLIGCIIGRQGSKINEIRQMSGAQIKIANATEGSAERQVTITGSPANISLAQYLINSATPTSTPTSMAVLAAASAVTVSTPPPLPTLPTTHYAVPVSSLLGMKTVPLLALNAAAAAGATGSLSAYTAKIPSTSGVKKSDRQKFAPY
uniref:K Homology domain-containing protein n=1 Tax=Anas platyrhynchos platyrhynchos TaxID=8840 RepID=A0A493U368_ANAPP